MKNITIAGRLTKDAETRQAGSDNVTSFSVAVDDRQGKEKTTLFFDCSIWGKRGDSLREYLTKGTSITASGDLSKREHDGKTYLTVRVNEVTLQGGKSQGDREAVKSDGRGSSESVSGNRDFYDDSSIPF